MRENFDSKICDVAFNSINGQSNGKTIEVFTCISLKLNELMNKRERVPNLGRGIFKKVPFLASFFFIICSFNS